MVSADSAAWTEAASDFTCCNDKSSSDPVVSVDALV